MEIGNEYHEQQKVALYPTAAAALLCLAWGHPLPSTSPSMEEEDEEVPAGFCWEMLNSAHAPAPARSVSNGILFIRVSFSLKC